MNKRKRNQLILVCVIFIVILAAYLGFKYYMNHLPEEEENVITVLDIDTSQVTEIGITNGEETMDLEKDGDTWKCLEDDTFLVDTDMLQTFLDAAGTITSELMIEEVTDMDQYGLEKPSISIALQWDSNLYMIHIGDQNTVAGGCYYLRMNDENTVYTISSYQYNALNKTKEDFAAEEEEEETESESESVNG
ncbi:MAG: DUF4340 domain-containing protein [Suilimivivens sp.]